MAAGWLTAMACTLGVVLLPWPGHRWRALLYGLVAAVVRS